MLRMYLKVLPKGLSRNQEIGVVNIYNNEYLYFIEIGAKLHNVQLRIGAWRGTNIIICDIVISAPNSGPEHTECLWRPDSQRSSPLLSFNITSKHYVGVDKSISLTVLLCYRFAFNGIVLAGSTALTPLGCSPATLLTERSHPFHCSSTKLFTDRSLATKVKHHLSLFDYFVFLFGLKILHWMVTICHYHCRHAYFLSQHLTAIRFSWLLQFPENGAVLLQFPEIGAWHLQLPVL